MRISDWSSDVCSSDLLQPSENLVSVAAGDTVRWVIGDTTSGTGADKRTHILVKPFTSGLATNLVVTTDRRSYHLQLTATARTAMAALSWTYPADQLIALRRAADQADRKSNTSELQSLMRTSYAVFCLKKKKHKKKHRH